MNKYTKEISELGEQYANSVSKNSLDNKNVTVNNIVKDYSHAFNTLQICFLSDPHIGSSDFDYKSLLFNLQYADSQENAVVFFLGDIMNTAIVGSKSDPYEDVLSPQEQLDMFESLLKIAKGDEKLVKVLQKLNDTGKIAVVHSGNHENRITKAVGISPTKIAADYAGVGEAFAPFYACTDLVLGQDLSPDKAFHFRVVTHHGTGLHNLDGTQGMMRMVGNGNMYVVGHTHQYSHTMDRVVRMNDQGEQVYSDVIRMCLPASGGGTYGAGMSLPDIARQTAVWLMVSSQQNPHAGKISPTGVKYPDIVPACAFFTPTITPDTNIKKTRMSQATRALNNQKLSDVDKKVDDLLEYIMQFEESARKEILNKIREKQAKAPAGFEAWLKEREKKQQEKVVQINQDEEDEM